MGFFTDKWVVVKLDSKELILVRKSKRNIFLERISQYRKCKELLTSEVLEEYDVSTSPEGIYILYQNIKGHLILIVKRGNKKEEVCLTTTGLSEVFNLSLEVKDKYIHVLYTFKEKEDKYFINHHFYDGNVWRDFLVDEIVVKKIINPMKIIVTDDKLLLVYYNDDYNISLKSFSFEELTWGNSTRLVGGDNEKLFLDGLIVDNSLHLSFCEYIDGNLVVKYFRYDCKNENYEKEIEESISNEGSPSHPTIIYFKDELWITWLELDKVFSRCSKNNGEGWSQIYMWNETKNIDFIRYKYVTNKKDENIYLNYSFGSIYPEISFLGFGPTEKAVEIPVKKNHIELHHLKNKIEELENRMKLLEISINNVENYLEWRTRGSYRKIKK